MERAAVDVLTLAEWRVVEAVRHGMSNPQIARCRGISIDSIKYQVANALQKLGLSSCNEIHRWPGIRRDSRLYSQELNMGKSDALGSVGQIARSVQHIDAARHWYGEVLGLKHLYSFGHLAFFDCSGLRLMLSQGDGGAAESIIYFRVEDIRLAQSTLVARGVEFTHAPHMIHRHDDGAEEWMAFFKDNEGRPLALMSQVVG